MIAGDDFGDGHVVTAFQYALCYARGIDGGVARGYTPAEANQLATPISNMIAKSEKLQNMGEYADAISLVTASLVIFAPRAMVYHEQKKQKKIDQNGGVKIVRKDETGKVQRSDRKPDGASPAPVPKHDPDFLSAVPAISY